MGVTTVFPKPSRPIKGGSRNSGTAVRSPAPQRDRHEEGARSLACWGFSRVLPELKDVPGEAAAGAWGSRCLRGTRRISGIPQPAALVEDGSGGQDARRRGVLAVSPNPSAGSPGVAARRGGGARLPAGPAPPTGPSPPWPLVPTPWLATRPRGSPTLPPASRFSVPFSSGLKY